VLAGGVSGLAIGALVVAGLRPLSPGVVLLLPLAAGLVAIPQSLLLRSRGVLASQWVLSALVGAVITTLVPPIVYVIAGLIAGWDPNRLNLEETAAGGAMRAIAWLTPGALVAALQTRRFVGRWSLRACWIVASGIGGAALIFAPFAWQPGGALLGGGLGGLVYGALTGVVLLRLPLLRRSTRGVEAA
jgi:hypothetical protein